jgi:hypothetical protein
MSLKMRNMRGCSLAVAVAFSHSVAVSGLSVRTGTSGEFLRATSEKQPIDVGYNS